MARTLLVWGLDKNDMCHEEDMMTEHGDCGFRRLRETSKAMHMHSPEFAVSSAVWVSASMYHIASMHGSQVVKTLSNSTRRKTQRGVQQISRLSQPRRRVQAACRVRLNWCPQVTMACRSGLHA